MQIIVLGAGAWGTALAIAAARRQPVSLWARDPLQASAMRAERRNARYLPEAVFPSLLEVPEAPPEAGALADALVVVGTPMSGLRSALQGLPPKVRVLWLCKGFEAGTGLLGHQIAAEVLPEARIGVLSGPSFAQEVARGLPTALVVASVDTALAELAVASFHSDNLRVYSSADPIGVEVGGAVKNVLAIATGISDGLGLGLNARAALITRGLAEMSRLGLAMGARAETFMGLTGLGDLVLTATGELSRNRRVGLALAEGLPLEQVLARLGHVAEGVYSAATVVETAHRLGVEMPLTEAVHAVISGGLTPRMAVERLMMRGSRAESF
jgi:glycerol-3-phosphate dehydrogenase (NAD(P)+)